MTSPFGDPGIGSAFCHESPAGAAELKIGYAFEQGLEAAVLVGGSGLGKTTLVRRLANRVAAAGHTVVDVFFARLDCDGLLAFVDQELCGAEHAIGNEREARLRRIAQRARQLAQEGRALAILIDDAHLLRDAATFETLHLLLNLREREGIRLTVLLAGHAALMVDLTQSPAFAQRVAVTATLTPLDLVQTATYVRHRLRSAGWDEGFFDDEAHSTIHSCSNGVPRAINRLCEMALLVAQTEQRQRVFRRDIDALASELPAFGRDAA